MAIFSPDTANLVIPRRKAMLPGDIRSVQSRHSTTCRRVSSMSDCLNCWDIGNLIYWPRTNYMCSRMQSVNSANSSRVSTDAGCSLYAFTGYKLKMFLAVHGRALLLVQLSMLGSESERATRTRAVTRMQEFFGI